MEAATVVLGSARRPGVVLFDLPKKDFTVKVPLMAPAPSVNITYPPAPPLTAGPERGADGELTIKPTSFEE